MLGIRGSGTSGVAAVTEPPDVVMGIGDGIGVSAVVGTEDAPDPALL